MQNLKTHLLINPARKQRVFFCGDVHGDKKALDQALAEVNFVVGKDMLIFVGDIIDRGDHSEELIDYVVNTPNIYSVIGNHEALFLNAIENNIDVGMYTSFGVGGSWIKNYSSAELRVMAAQIREHFPLSITVQTPIYKIGVIHASGPDDWDALPTASDDEWDAYLWSLHQHQRAYFGAVHIVKNVDVVMHGHVCNYKFLDGNHFWIDTLFYTGRLTVIEASEVMKAAKDGASVIFRG